jgi:hypothetical protein
VKLALQGCDGCIHVRDAGAKTPLHKIRARVLLILDVLLQPGDRCGSINHLPRARGG